MNRGNMSRLASVIVAGSLLFGLVPPGPVDAKPVTDLTVDVWMDKGGQGEGKPGGEYNLGETPVIYFSVSIGCHAQISLKGPDGTNAWESQAMYGPVYQITLGVAEAADIGQWNVVLEAETSTGDQRASDAVSFAVVGPSTMPSQPPGDATPETEPTDTTPTPPISTPSSSPQPGSTTQSTSTSARKSFTALDALKALKMAEGALSPNVAMDADSDGSLTLDDARLVLKWAIENRARLALERHVMQMQMVAPNTWDVSHERITGIASPAEGIVIETADMQLTVPLGAVLEDTEIVIKRLNEPPPFLEYKAEYAEAPWAMAFGPVHDFGPEGLEFQEPVQIVLSYDETMLPVGTTEENIVPVYFNGVDWISMPAIVDTELNTVSMRTRSFPGQFIEFTVVYGVKLAIATGAAVLVWAYGGGGEAVVSQVAKDPVYWGSAAEYVTPNDPKVVEYAQKVVADVGNRKYASFGDEAELAVLMRDNPVAGERLIRFDLAKRPIGPDYQVSQTSGNDWQKPADYANGGMKGDCKNIANFYCSVLRNLKMNAKCVDGYMLKGQRHAWVEVEIDGKAYYIGDSGELTPLEDAVKELKLIRPPKGVNGQGFMWDENGQVPYEDEWWKKLPPDPPLPQPQQPQNQQSQAAPPDADECIVSIRCRICSSDTGEQRCYDETNGYLVKGTLSQSGSEYRFEGSNRQESSQGVIETALTVMFDDSCSEVTSFELFTTGMGNDEFVTITIKGEDLRQSPAIEALVQSDGLSGEVYGVQGFDTCSHITTMKTNQGNITYECNPDSMIAVVLGNDLSGQLLAQANAAPPA